jgi:hypothetical protein
MQQAVDIADFLSVLSRRGWGPDRIEAYARTLVDSGLPVAHLATSARRLVGELDADDVSPARVIADAKQHVPDVPLLPAPDDAPRYHPGEGSSGNRPPVVMPDPYSRAKLRAFYARRLEETRRAIAKQRTSPMREAVAPAIEGMLRMWLQHTQRCDWCRVKLTPECMRQYVEWAANLGRERPVGTRMPEAKVFCDACAVDAIIELHGGSRYVPTRGVA